VSRDLAAFTRIAAMDHGLCVVNTVRVDGTIQSSVVNAGVLVHPTSGDQAVGLVAVGGSAKLANLRKQRRLSVVARSGWQWATVEGDADLIGPDDPWPGIDAEALRQLLREVFTAAGGTHDDWEEYDRTMAVERRTAVLVTPVRTYGVSPE